MYSRQQLPVNVLSGTTTLTAANTYTGETTISAGMLNITNSSALGSTAGGTTVAAAPRCNCRARSLWATSR